MVDPLLELITGALAIIAGGLVCTAIFDRILNRPENLDPPNKRRRD